jgi:hypothetical protein
LHLNIRRITSDEDLFQGFDSAWDQEQRKKNLADRATYEQILAKLTAD